MTDKETIIAAQEAEILRLQQGFDELKKFCNSDIDDFDDESLYDQGIRCGFRFVIKELNRITGASND